MDRQQLAHVLRAAADVTGETEMVVIGSQAILGTFANPPAELLVSVEVDLYPLRRPELADQIDGAIGEGSRFNDTFGYYAHGVGPETAIAPYGWEERLVPFSPPDADHRIRVVQPCHGNVHPRPEREGWRWRDLQRDRRMARRPRLKPGISPNRLWNP